MDDAPDPTLPAPVVVRHQRERAASSLTWSLPMTTLAVLGLSGLTALTFAVDSLGHGALVVLAPLGDSTPTAPDPHRYVIALAIGAAIGLVTAGAGSVAWDRRRSATPAAARGLVVAVAASVPAFVVVALGLGLL